MTKVVEMKDPTGAVAKGYIGFSVSVLVFSLLVPLFRGHLIAFIAMLAAYVGFAVVVGMAFSGSGDDPQAAGYAQLLAIGLNIVFAATYNGWHRSWLLKRGYLPVSEATDMPDNRPAYVRDIDARKAAAATRKTIV